MSGNAEMGMKCLEMLKWSINHMIYYTLLILTNKQAYIKFNNTRFPLKPRGKET
jgi:hypothetical protein